MIYLIPIKIRAPLIFAPLIFAPLIFAHPKKPTIRAPLIFAHWLKFALLIFAQVKIKKKFYFIFACAKIKGAQTLASARKLKGRELSVFWGARKLEARKLKGREF